MILDVNSLLYFDKEVSNIIKDHGNVTADMYLFCAV
jgi:hypothetical protein